MESGPEFDWAHTDANSPAVAFTVKAKLRHAIFESAIGGDENIRAPSIPDGAPSNYEIMLSPWE